MTRLLKLGHGITAILFINAFSTITTWVMEQTSPGHAAELKKHGRARSVQSFHAVVCGRLLVRPMPVSYTHLTLPTIYSV